MEILFPVTYSANFIFFYLSTYINTSIVKLMLNISKYSNELKVNANFLIKKHLFYTRIIGHLHAHVKKYLYLVVINHLNKL